MERLKIAIFCWENLYGDRVGGLSNAATYLAQSLAKNHEVHFFTRGDDDFEMNGVYYHVYRPHGNNVVEYCSDLSRGLVNRFYQCDDPGFDVLHFHDWHVTEALHLLQHRPTVFSFHSTGMEEMEMSMATGGNTTRSAARNGMPA